MVIHRMFLMLLFSIYFSSGASERPLKRSGPVAIPLSAIQSVEAKSLEAYEELSTSPSQSTGSPISPSGSQELNVSPLLNLSLSTLEVRCEQKSAELHNKQIQVLTYIDSFAHPQKEDLLAHFEKQQEQGLKELAVLHIAREKRSLSSQRKNYMTLLREGQEQSMGNIYFAAPSSREIYQHEPHQASVSPQFAPSDCP